MLLNDAWPQERHSTSHSLNFQINRSDQVPQVTCTVSLVIADHHFNLSQGFVWLWELEYLVTVIPLDLTRKGLPGYS